MTNNLLVFPNFEQLSKKSERLRTELSMLLLERDELQFVICKNIETVYMLKLGGYEYKAFETQCAFLQIKRKHELIQGKINRQEKVNINSIDKILDKEFSDYKEKLNEQIDKMNEAIENSKATLLSKEDSNELKKLYRKIVKDLHPDLNPNITESQKQLFENAVNAYKNGDLTTLRIIGQMVCDFSIQMPSVDTVSLLEDNIKNLENMINSINKSISKIKNNYPYTMKAIIEDDAKIEEQKAELEEIILQYKDGIKIYQNRIDELMGV